MKPRNAVRFSEHPRWRRGRPWSLLDCIDTLAASGLPYLLRYDAYLELAIRSGHVIHFEPGWEIPRQREAIQQDPAMAGVVGPGTAPFDWQALALCWAVTNAVMMRHQRPATPACNG